MNYNEIDEGVKEYFKSLSKYKPLTKEEEHKLLALYKANNDLEARNKVITSNLKYACSLANSFRGQGISFSELISYANDGLIESIDSFDLSYDDKFFSYAKWKIIRNMQLALEKKARYNECDLPDVDKFDDDFDNTYDNGDKLFSDDEIYENDNKKQYIKDLSKVLSEREKTIVTKYFGLDGNEEQIMEDIGKMYKISKVRIRQILKKAIDKLRCNALLIDNKYLYK